MGSATAGTKQLTLADREAAINVGEHLKEIVRMEELSMPSAPPTMPWLLPFL
jgi:hypothetical protein